MRTQRERNAIILSNRNAVILSERLILPSSQSEAESESKDPNRPNTQNRVASVTSPSARFSTCWTAGVRAPSRVDPVADILPECTAV